MRKSVIISGLIIISFFSCKSENVKERIAGIWFSENSINTLISNDNSHDSELYFYQSFPVIYDFNENGDLYMKNFRGNDSIFKWSLKSESILTINKLDFHINYLSHDSIEIIYKDKHNYKEFCYIRPKEIQIKQAKSEIEKILLSNIWTTNDSAYKDIREHFEFFDNQTMIYRYKFDAKYDSISPDNLQLETWGIAKYKDYAFLYNFRDKKLVNGYIDAINQIVDINDTTFTLLTSYHKKTETKYIRKKTPDNKEAIKKIYGNWTSMNTKKKSYGNFPKYILETGRVELYEGKLNMTITSDSLSFRIHDLNPMTRNWQLSKDGKILVFEYKIDEPERKGIHVEFADILELTDRKLKIRLLDNYFYTGLNKPQEYMLNLIQVFEKVD